MRSEATLDEMAAIDFEPIAAEDLAKIEPTFAEWRSLGRRHLETARLAWQALGKTKAELGALDEGALVDLIEKLAVASRYFESYTKLLQAVEARVLAASAASVA